MTRIAAALLGANPLRLEDAIAATEQSTASYLHLDLMDGHYTDDLSFGLRTVDAIAARARLPLDIHLQIFGAQHYFPHLTGLGVARIAFHVDAVDAIDEAIDMLTTADKAIDVGLVLNPDQPAEAIVEFLPRLKYIILMTSRPGTSTFEPSVLDKIRALRGYLDRRSMTGIQLVADGGITNETAPAVVAAGADTLVAASAIFQTPDRDIAAAVTRLANAGSRTQPLSQ